MSRAYAKKSGVGRGTTLEIKVGNSRPTIQNPKNLMFQVNNQPGSWIVFSRNHWFATPTPQLLEACHAAKLYALIEYFGAGMAK